MLKYDVELKKLTPASFFLERVLGCIGFTMSANSDVVIRVRTVNDVVETKVVHWTNARGVTKELSNGKGWEQWLLKE